MNHFYLTLPSNSSMQIYPKNTLSSFTTKLPEDINLTGEWEVGLKELQFPQTWYNINDMDGEFIIDLNNVTDQSLISESSSELGSSLEVHCLLYPGYYSSCEQLATMFNSITNMSIPGRLHGSIHVTYEEVTGKFIMVLKYGVSIVLSKSLAHMFGFRRVLRHSQRSRKPSDIRRGIYSLYIYCNICREIIVGDSKVDLLRIVPIQGEHGDYICKTYDSPTYTPLQRKNFNDIKIDIRDDVGEKIPFQSGKVIVTLHLRKRGLLFN